MHFWRPNCTSVGNNQLFAEKGKTKGARSRTEEYLGGGGGVGVQITFHLCSQSDVLNPGVADLAS